MSVSLLTDTDWTKIQNSQHRMRLAAVAMQGLLADPSLVNTPEEIAKEAVEHADALLKELAK